MYWDQITEHAQPINWRTYLASINNHAFQQQFQDAGISEHYLAMTCLKIEEKPTVRFETPPASSKPR